MAIGTTQNNSNAASEAGFPLTRISSDVAEALSQVSIEEIGVDVLRRRASVDQIDEAPIFSPALWRQRRAFASTKLKDWGVKSVLDLGCGEGALLEILLNDSHFEQLIGVDCNEESLSQAVGQCQPTPLDYLNLRETPLDLRFYKGSVEFADSDVTGYEAITCLEVIEHLDPHVVQALPETTLGQYRPKYMILSTPNFEFNVFFPHLIYGTPEKRLRHDDHRFEWTRSEFESWAQQAAEKYGYVVEFDGVGHLPESFRRQHYRDVGPCSQIALFSRRSDNVQQSWESSQHYELFETIEYPHLQQKKDDDILNLIYQWTEDLVPVDADGWARKGSQIELEKFWNVSDIKDLCNTKEKLVKIFRSPIAQESFHLDEEETLVTVLYDLEPIEPNVTAHEPSEGSDWGYCSDEDDIYEGLYVPREPEEDADDVEDFYDAL